MDIQFILSAIAFAVVLLLVIAFAAGFLWGNSRGWDEGYNIGQINQRRADRHEIFTRK